MFECLTADQAVKLVSSQLVPMDDMLAKLLGISGTLFAAWFFVQVRVYVCCLPAAGALTVHHALTGPRHSMLASSTSCLGRLSMGLHVAGS